MQDSRTYLTDRASLKEMGKVGAKLIYLDFDRRRVEAVSHGFDVDGSLIVEDGAVSYQHIISPSQVVEILA